MHDGPEAVPWPDKPWNEIIPNLFQGGAVCSYDGQRYDKVVVTDEFDLVISLYKEHGTGPDDSVMEYHVPIPDGKLQGAEQELLWDLLPIIALALTEDRKVLVRCQAGYNRSGLVVGLALIFMGSTADEAIELIKSKRSRWALFNGYFQQYLHDFERDLGRADALREAVEGSSAT